MIKETTSDKIKREFQGMLEGGPPGILSSGLFTWAAGRQAGLKAYLAEQGEIDSLPDFPFAMPKYFEKDTLEQISIKKMFNHVGSELAGLGKSYLPLFLSVCMFVATQEPDVKMPQSFILSSNLIHWIGGYLLSRHHAKHVLAPKYDAYRQDLNNNIPVDQDDFIDYEKITL
jgi:hypothetical protein